MKELTENEFVEVMVEYLRDLHGLSKKATLDSYRRGFAQDYRQIREAGLKVVK